MIENVIPNRKPDNSPIFDENDNYVPDFSLDIDNSVQIDFRTYAKIITQQCVKIHEGQTVLIMGLYTALPLIKEIYREILNCNAYPVRPLVDFPGRRFLLYQKGNLDLLKIMDPMAEFFNTQVDVVISIYDMMYPDEMAKIPSEKIKINERAYTHIEMLKDQNIREGKHQEIYVGYPFAFNASRYNLSVNEYKILFEKVYLLDQPDPLEAWSKLEKEGDEMVEFLKSFPNLYIQSKEMDLHFTLEPSKIINSMGHEYLPDGKISAVLNSYSIEGQITLKNVQIAESEVIESLTLTYLEGKIQFETLIGKLGPKMISNVKNLYGNIAEFGLGILPVSDIMKNNPMSNYLKSWGMTFIFEGLIYIAFGPSEEKPDESIENSFPHQEIFDLRNTGTIYAEKKPIFKDGHLIFPNG